MILFGEYLIQQGLVIEDDLDRALQSQARERVPVGQLAIQQGFLEQKGLLRVLNAQKRAVGKSKVFGRIAVGFGLMTEEQVNKLLKIQAENRKLLGVVLVSQGALSGAQLIKALKGYKDLQNKEA